MPRKTPAKQMTAKERLEKRRSKIATTTRTDGMPVRNVDKMTQLDKAMDDEEWENTPSRRQRQLEFTLQRLTIADLYLSGYSADEIAGKLGYSTEYVTKQITTVQIAVNQRMMALSENLVLIQLSRTEQLMKSYFPLALDMDDRAFDRVVKLMQLQLELKKSVIIPDSDESMNALERFQRTITSNSLLYEIVQANIGDDWVKDSSMTVDDLFKKVAEFGELDTLKDQVTKLEEAFNAGETGPEEPDQASPPGVQPANGETPPGQDDSPGSGTLDN